MFLIIIFLSLITFIILAGYVELAFAYFLGDKSLRLRFKPLSQIDFFSSILLPLFLIIISKATIFFGYQKTHHINYYHFKKPKRDLLLVILSGYLVYLLFVVFFTIISKIPFIPKEIIVILIGINLSLFLFNLLPIYPFSCFKILDLFLPQRLYFFRKKIFSLLVFLILIYIDFFKWYSNFIVDLSLFLTSFR